MILCAVNCVNAHGHLRTKIWLRKCRDEKILGISDYFQKHEIQVNLQSTDTMTYIQFISSFGKYQNSSE